MTRKETGNIYGFDLRDCLCGILFLLWGTAGFAQSAHVTIGGNDIEQSYSILQTSDYGYVIAGYTLSYGQSMNITGDVYLMKVAANGNLVWTETVGGAGYDEGYGMVQADDGGFAVAGVTYSSGAGGADMYVLKFTSAGALSWAKTLGEAAGDEYGNCITKAADGSYAVAGFSTSYGSGDEDIFLAKFTVAGNLSWSRTFGGAGYERANSIITVSDGYVMAGTTNSYGQGNYDLYVVKYNLSGTYQWSQAIGGAGWDEAYELIQDTDGNLVVAGYTDSYGAGIGESYLVKLDAVGNLLWTKTFGNAKQGWNNHVLQGSDGNYVVAGGYVPTAAAAWDGFIAKYDVSGTLLWEKNFGLAGGPEYMNGLIQNNAGEYVMCGNTSSFGTGPEIYVAKLTNGGSFCGTSGVQGTEASGGIASGSGGSNTNRTPTLGSGGTESSGGALTNQCGTLANLPVTLLSFSGFAESNSIKLSWSTASEENNNFFTLERSIDGKTFYEIGKINGAGNSNSIRYYEFTDELPAQQNHYRLSQTDFNGQHEELGIISVNFMKDARDLVLQIQSNPVTDNNLALNLFSPKEDDVVLRVMDLQGRTLRQGKYSFDKGETRLISLDLSGVRDGVYFISATSINSSVNGKFLLLNRE